jgi:4'-phosphopantetheinyl transferase
VVTTVVDGRSEDEGDEGKGDEVEFWVIRTDRSRPVVERLAGLLAPEERARACGLVDPVGRDRFTVVHGAVRLLAAERLGVPAAGLRWHRGPHGKPEPVGAESLPGGLQLNYSASGALAVLALAVGRQVGVDVEEVPDERVATRVARRFFPAEDAGYVASGGSPAIRAARFTGLWCRREACVKVFGGRLVQGLRLPVAGPGPVRLPDVGELGGGGTCSVRDVSLGPGFPGFRAAVAVEGGQNFRVRRRLWPGNGPAGPIGIDMLNSRV